MTNLVFNNIPGTQKQPYKSWKGIKNSGDINHTTNSTVPSNSQPQENARGPGFINQRRPIASKNNARAAPNPIKHWRKQLIPSQGISSGKPSIGQIIDRPGGSTHLVSNLELDCSKRQHSIKNYINKDTPSTYQKLFKKSDNCYIDSKTGKKEMISNPARIRLPASTVLNKKYYTTTKAYLKSRIKLYEQNQTISAVNKNLPSEFHSINCIERDCNNDDDNHDDNNNNKTKVIYKPNNPGYSKQGAVTSSNRIVKLKYNTIQDSACCQNNEWNNEGSSSLQYRGNAEAPYFIKSKTELPINECKKNTSINGRKPLGGVGIHTVYIKTLSSDLQHNKSSHISSLRGVGTGKLITPQLSNCKLTDLCKNSNKNLELIKKLQLPCAPGELPINTQGKNGNKC